MFWHPYPHPWLPLCLQTPDHVPRLRPRAQPTRTHGHVPRLLASGPADPDPCSRPSAPGLGPSQLGLKATSLGSGPRAWPTRTDLAPAHAGPVRPRDARCQRHQTTARCTVWGDPTVSAWSCVPVEDAALPPRRSGPVRPRRAARGASGPPRRIRLSRGPGLRAHPVLTPIRLRPIVQGHPPPSGRYLENMVRTTWTPARLYASEPPHPG